MTLFDDHPVVVLMAAALFLAVFATVSLFRGEWVAGTMAYVDAVGMVALAAHARVEGSEG